MANLGVMLSQLGLILNNSLTDQQITTLINLADLEEAEARPWARLKTEFIFNSFAGYTTGTVTTVQGSATVTGAGTNWTDAMIGMYFKAGGLTGSPASASTFAPVRIDSVASPTTLTLQTVWPYTGSAGGAYQIFPLFYSLPAFQRVVGVRQMVPLQRRTHEWINFRDPYRTQQSSPAVYWAPFGRDSDDNAKIELWPIETAANGYTAYGLKGHRDLQNPTDYPVIPSAVLVNKVAASAWSTLYSLHGDPRQANQRDYYQARYLEELNNALDSDREEYGTIGKIQEYQDSNEESGEYIPGLDAIFNRDPV